MAETLFGPFAAVDVSQVTAYGATVSSEPRFAPSSTNCTPATPTLSPALAETVIEPLTVVAFVGAVSVTDGGVVSLGGAASTSTTLRFHWWFVGAVSLMTAVVPLVGTGFVRWTQKVSPKSPKY